MTYYVGRTTGSGVTALTGDFEAGTNGSTIKTTDPGSLTPWSAISGTATTYSTTSPAHGSLCAACPSTTLSWTTASVTELWGRYYLNASVLPTGSSFSTLVTGIQSNGSTIAFSIRLAQASVAGSAGKLNVQGVTSGGNKYGTVAISTTGWIRIEFHAVINATTGSIEVKLYNSADSNTPDDTILYSGINTGTDVATLRYGAGWAATTIYMDQMVGFASAYPGPFPVNSVAPAVSGSAPVGSMLACDGGTWNNTFTLGYQWTSNGSNIAGATSSTYTTQAGDVGNAIGCTVTATGQQATNEQASQASGNTVTVTSIGGGGGSSTLALASHPGRFLHQKGLR